MLEKILASQEENNELVEKLCKKVENLEEKINFLTNEVISFSANYYNSFIKIFFYNYINIYLNLHK